MNNLGINISLQITYVRMVSKVLYQSKYVVSDTFWLYFLSFMVWWYRPAGCTPLSTCGSYCVPVWSSLVTGASSSWSPSFTTAIRPFPWRHWKSWMKPVKTRWGSKPHNINDAWSVSFKSLALRASHVFFFRPTCMHWPRWNLHSHTWGTRVYYCC